MLLPGGRTLYARTGVLYPIGITLSPAVGALRMRASTVIVAVNATTLRRVKLT